MKKRIVSKKIKKDNKNKIRNYNFIYDNFILALKYLKEIRGYFFFSLIMFFVIGLIGYFFPIFFGEQIINWIKEIISQTEGLGPFGLITFIIFNNMQSAFFAMIFGLIIGVIPLGILAINGYVIGFVSNMTVAVEGPLILWRLLPHGIFEIPAVLISIALGLKLGSFSFKAKNKSKTFLFILFTFLIFLVVMSVIFTIISFVVMASTGLGLSDMEILQDNPVFSNIMGHPILALVMAGVWIASIIFGTFFLEKDDKKEFFKLFFNVLRVYILIVIPLLVIAGIIEGTLILFIG